MIVLDRKARVSAAQLEAAEQLLYRECELLNTARYDDWLALFSLDCRYFAPLIPGQEDVESHSSLFLENRELMRMRIRRVTHEAAHSLAGGVRASRTVGPAALRAVDSQRGDWTVERRVQMTERQGGRMRHFAGLFTYRLRFRERFMIREKRVDLIDCDAPHEPLEIFL